MHHDFFQLSEASLAPRQHQLLLIQFVNPGELIGPQARQPAFLFCPDKPRVVRAELEQEFASRIALGQPAIVENDGGVEGPTWKGHVTRVSGWLAPHRFAGRPALPGDAHARVCRATRARFDSMANRPTCACEVSQ
jgi:hypothetical protein